MTSLLHPFGPDATPFEDRMQLAQLERIAGSRAAETDAARDTPASPCEQGPSSTGNRALRHSVLASTWRKILLKH